VVRPDRVEALHDRHRLLVRSGIPAPQSLGWTPQGILVLQALPGRTLRQALRTRTTPIPCGGDILAFLDGLPQELAQGTPRQSWIDKAPHYAAVIGAALPTEAARAARLAEALVVPAGPAWPGPVHGDFYEGQLLVDRGRGPSTTPGRSSVPQPQSPASASPVPALAPTASTSRTGPTPCS
jgi:hypothetical protein